MHITTIGLDIAKNMFQVHGIDAAEKVVIRKQLRRGQVLKFFAALPPYHTGDRQKAPKIARFSRLRTTSVLCPIRQQDASSITHRCPSAQVANPQDDSIFHPRTWQPAARLEVSFHRLQRDCAVGARGRMIKTEAGFGTVARTERAVAFTPSVRGADIDGGDVVRSEQSRERVLGNWLLAPAGAPFRPWTVLHLGQSSAPRFICSAHMRGSHSKFAEALL